MNTEQLHVALQQSFSPDANLRLPAEETIKNLKHIPGASKMLLEIASERQVRQYLLIWFFKNSFISNIFNYRFNLKLDKLLLFN